MYANNRLSSTGKLHQLETPYFIL